MVSVLIIMRRDTATSVSFLNLKPTAVQCPGQGADEKDQTDKLRSSYDAIWNQAVKDGLEDFKTMVGLPKTWDKLNATELQKIKIKLAQLKYAIETEKLQDLLEKAKKERDKEINTFLTEDQKKTFRTLKKGY